MKYLPAPKVEKVRKKDTIASRLDREFTKKYQSFNTPSISAECEYYLKSKSAYVGQILTGNARNENGKLIWKWSDRIAALKKEMDSMGREITSKYSSEINSYSANKINQYVANIGKAIDVTFTENASLKRKYDKTSSNHIMDKENHDIRNRLYSVMGAINSLPANRNKKDLETKVEREERENKIGKHRLSRDTLLEVVEDEKVERFIGVKATFLVTPPSEMDKTYLRTLAKKIQIGERKYWGDRYLNDLVTGAPLAAASEEFAKDTPLNVKIEDLTKRDSQVNIVQDNLPSNTFSQVENKPQKRLFKKTLAYAVASLAAITITTAAVSKFINLKPKNHIEQKEFDSRNAISPFKDYHASNL